MKKLITIFLLLAISSYAFGQAATSKNPQYTYPTYHYGGLNVGAKTDANKFTITKITKSGNKTSLYSGSTLLSIVNPDSASYKTFGIYKKDSAYRKPGSYVPMYSFKNKYMISNLRIVAKELGSTTKMLPIACELGGTGATTAMSDGTVYYALSKVVDTCTIASMTFTLNVQGNYTGDNYNGVGIYSISGNTATLLASSTNDANLWKPVANTATSVNLATPYVAVPGYYLMALLYNNSAQTTAPTIHGVSAPSWAQYGLVNTNGIVFTGYSSATKTALPATVNVTTEIYPTATIGVIIGK